MKRQLCVLLVLLSAVSISFADAKIPVKHRAANVEPGYCAWAALETCCRHQGIKAGSEMIKSRSQDPDETYFIFLTVAKNAGRDWIIEKKLVALGIKFKMSRKGDYNIDVIKAGLAQGKGVVVAMYRGLPTTDDYHAITLTSFDEKTRKYTYIDSNKPSVEFEGTLDWFWQEWDGFAVYLK